jgi:GNAT superfamily N-acetyltransferase
MTSLRSLTGRLLYGGGMRLDIATIADRPELAPLANRFPGGWHEFMYHDQVADLYFDHTETTWAGYALIAVDAANPSRPVARAYSVPFDVPADPADLPPDGWDRVVLNSVADRVAGRRGAQVSALEITVQPELRGKGLAGQILNAMRDNAKRRGHDVLVAPVRPSAKSDAPTEPIDEYAYRVRADGLPVDPWLRVHVRAGATIVKVAPRSMTIAGTLDEWRAWTGLPFDRPGPVIVPGALVPVHCDPVQGVAVYVEPNVWVRHELT